MAVNDFLLVSELAALKLRYAAEELPNKEISGFGKVKIHDNGQVEVVDIVIPPQVIGTAHVDIGPDVRDAFWAEVIKNGCKGLDCERRQDDTRGRDEGWVDLPPRGRKVNCTARWCNGEGRAVKQDPDPEGADAFCAECYDRWIHLHDEQCNNGNIRDWRVWWHKHPGTSKPSPSGTDTDTLAELAGPEGFGFGWMLGIIISSDASNVYCWLNNALGPWALEQKDVQVRYMVRESKRVRDSIRAQVATVREAPRPTYNTTPNMMGGRWDPDKKRYVYDDDKGKPAADGHYTHTPSGSATTALEKVSERTFRHPSDIDASPANVHLEGVSEVRPSELYPGNIEIVKKDGTIIVTKDMGQFKAGTPGEITGKKPGERAPKKARSRINQHISNEGIRWVGQGTATELQARDGTVYVGFDLNGMPCIKGEERGVYYVVDHALVARVADPEVRNGLPQTTSLLDVDRALVVAMGDDFIGYDHAGAPLQKGEGHMLAYDKEGQPVEEGLLPLTVVAERSDGLTAADIETLKRTYHMPQDIGDEDVYAYAYMMMGGGYFGV